MAPDDIAALADMLAPKVATYVLESDQFRLMLREAAMIQAAEQEKIKRQELPRVFCATAAQFGVRLYVRNREVYTNKPLPEELEKVRLLFGEEIRQFILSGPTIHLNGDGK